VPVVKKWAKRALVAGNLIAENVINSNHSIFEGLPMNIRNSLLSICAAAALLTVASAPVHAQFSMLDLNADSQSAVVTPAGYHDFNITATNTSGSELTVTITRSSKEYPEGWSSSICAGDLCYPPTRDASDPITIAPGESIHIKLTVVAGEEDGASGKVTLSFSTGLGGFPQSLDFQMNVSSASSVPTLSQSGNLSLYPNPTAGRLRFDYALPTAADVTINVSSMTGEHLLVPTSEFQRAGNHSLDLDLSTLPAGAYVVTMNAGGVRTSRIVTVAR
jgi:hypothetical protein